MGANDHKGLAGSANRNRRSCAKFEIFRQGEKDILETTVLAKTVAPQKRIYVD